jgi:hypothetical protein
VLVLREVKKEVQDRKDFFYKRIERRKEQVLAMLQELETEGR